MQLEKTLYNLINTKESFFNLRNEWINLDLLKKNLKVGYYDRKDTFYVFNLKKSEYLDSYSKQVLYEIVDENFIEYEVWIFKNIIDKETEENLFLYK